jgi:hypothetical protein
MQQKKNDSDQVQYYKKWLEEDVDYIISEEERAVFKKRTTRTRQLHRAVLDRRNPDPANAFRKGIIARRPRIRTSWESPAGGPTERISYQETG